MKRVSLFVMAAVFTGFMANAQTTTVDVNAKNSWLKAGLMAGVPVGNAADVSGFTAGVDLKGQLMETPNVGVGITTGYTQFFGKNGFDGFGNIPLGAFVRYYPQTQGFFAGADLGYSFVTGLEVNKGGAYVRPQLGYHNYNWNFFGYYNNVFRSDDNGGSIGNAGIGFTYNLRFSK